MRSAPARSATSPGRLARLRRGLGDRRGRPSARSACGSRYPRSLAMCVIDARTVLTRDAARRMPVTRRAPAARPRRARRPRRRLGRRRGRVVAARERGLDERRILEPRRRPTRARRPSRASAPASPTPTRGRPRAPACAPSASFVPVPGQRLAQGVEDEAAGRRGEHLGRRRADERDVPHPGRSRRRGRTRSAGRLRRQARRGGPCADPSLRLSWNAGPDGAVSPSRA